MLKILVTGANGFIGRALCQSLIDRGYSVRGSVRHCDHIIGGIEIFETGDIGSECNWSYILKDVNIVIHLAARAHKIKDLIKDPQSEFWRVNVLGTEKLALSASKAGIKRFIYLSSVGAIRTFSNVPLNEQSEINPDTPYGLSKFEAENILKTIANISEMEFVILRPPLLYGPGVPGNFARLLKLVDKGILLPLGGIKNLRSFLYLGNLIDVIITCISHPLAAGETFLVSDGQDVSTPELIHAIAKALGRPCRLISVSPFLLLLFGIIGDGLEKLLQCSLSINTETIRRLMGSLAVNSSKIRRVTGWMPRYSLADGLKVTAEWYLKTKR